MSATSFEAPRPAYEVVRGAFRITTDVARFDVDWMTDALSQRAYWALGRPRAMVERTLQTSLAFGLFEGERQIGVARVVTDFATFGWLCDVFVDEPFRGHGLCAWLVESVVAHPDLVGLRRIALATRDGAELYRRFGGFTALEAPERWMERRI